MNYSFGYTTDILRAEKMIYHGYFQKLKEFSAGKRHVL